MGLGQMILCPFCGARGGHNEGACDTRAERIMGLREHACDLRELGRQLKTLGAENAWLLAVEASKVLDQYAESLECWNKIGR